jgi:hypothetical protein
MVIVGIVPSLKNQITINQGVLNSRAPASQNLASGIISIVFGLTPIMTGVFALILLKDKFFSVNKILA